MHVYVNCMWWVYYTCARLIPGLISRNHLQPVYQFSHAMYQPRACSTRSQFAKQPLNFNFANADWDLTNIFANCKFDSPSSFQDILNNHTFSVCKCVRRNASQVMVSMVRTPWFGNISSSWIISQRIMFSDRARGRTQCTHQFFRHKFPRFVRRVTVVLQS
jgi:hypothetical protein